MMYDHWQNSRDLREILFRSKYEHMGFRLNVGISASNYSFHHQNMAMGQNLNTPNWEMTRP
jgi:hypothetical protein